MKTRKKRKARVDKTYHLIVVCVCVWERERESMAAPLQRFASSSLRYRAICTVIWHTHPALADIPIFYKNSEIFILLASWNKSNKGSCLKTGQHSIFFNYTFISAYKIFFFIPYQRYCFGYFVCATEFHCQLWF